MSPNDSNVSLSSCRIVKIASAPCLPIGFP